MSQGHNNNIDGLFRKQLRDHEVKPMPQVWSNLVDGLPVYTPIHKRTSFYAASLICTALVSSLLTWYLLSSQLNNAAIPSIPSTEASIAEQVALQNSNTLPISLQANSVLAPLATTVAHPAKEQTKLISKNSNHKALKNNADLTTIVNTTVTSEATVPSVNKPLVNHYVPLAININTLTTNINQEAFPTTLAQVATSTKAKLPFVVPFVANSPIPSSTPTTPSVGAISVIENQATVIPSTSKLLPIQSTNQIITPIVVNIIEEGSISKQTPSTPLVHLDLEAESVTPLTKEPGPSFIETKDQKSKTSTKKTVSTSQPTTPYRLLSNIAPSKNLYFGFVGAFNNTHLLTDKQRPIYKKALTFTPAYGFKLGYDFSKDFGIQAEWILRSSLGQNYTYIPTHSKEPKEQQLQLTYSQFPVTLKYRKYRFSSFTNQPIVVNYTAGVQYGMLKSAHLPTNNSRLIDAIYKNGSWGFVMGVDYDIYLNKNYFLSLGARSTLSTAANSFTDVQIPIPQTSNHLLFGLHMGLNYRFNQ